MKILLYGRNGQLGWELQRSLAPLGDVIALEKNDRGGDFTRPDEVIHTLRALAPDLIVNAAAFTAVEQAEREPALTHRINAETPARLAQEAARLSAWLVHYSSDYVFDGSGNAPRKETDAVAPLNVYGRSKAAAEKAIHDSGCLALVFRSSWVYAARGKNFLRTMLQLAGEREKLSVVNDQTGAPTGAELLADVTAHVFRQAHHEPSLAGLYHLAAAGETTWHAYACHVLAEARKLGLPLKVQPEDIVPIASEVSPARALRPLNSRLDTQKLRDRFGLRLPHWSCGVSRALEELVQS